MATSRMRAGWRPNKERCVSEIDRRWIVANVTAGIVSVVTGLLDYAVRIGFGAGAADTPVAATLAFTVVSVILFVGGFTVYAWFSAAVLRLIVPALPLGRWIALHVVIAVVLGAGLALTYTVPTGEPNGFRDATVREWVSVTLLFGAAFALAGAVFGALQALVLRGAAYGTGNWIVGSALSFAVVAITVLPLILISTNDGTFVRVAADQGMIFLAVVVSSSVMLPALRHLHPRTT